MCSYRLIWAYIGSFVLKNNILYVLVPFIKLKVLLICTFSFLTCVSLHSFRLFKIRFGMGLKLYKHLNPSKSSFINNIKTKSCDRLPYLFLQQQQQRNHRIIFSIKSKYNTSTYCTIPQNFWNVKCNLK